MLQNVKKTSAPGWYRVRTAGFTLIEMMIVVVIIAILAAIALPSYQQYVERSRRVDATETLLRMATLQERHFFQESKYYRVPALTDLGGQTSPEGWYTIAITHPGGGCGDVNAACNNFTLTATAVGPQLGDEDCRTFSIQQTLRQAAEKVGGDDTSDICW